MESGCLKFMKSIIKALVLSTPEKMTVEKLNKDYRATEGENIPFHRMGYKTLEAFLRSMPDTVQVCGSGCTAIVINVTSGKTKHIEQLVKGQKKTKVKHNAKPTIENPKAFRNVFPLSNVNFNSQKPNPKSTFTGPRNVHHGNPGGNMQLFTKSVQHVQSLGFTRNRNGFFGSTNRVNENSNQNHLHTTKVTSTGLHCPATLSKHHQPISYTQIEEEQLVTQFQQARLEDPPVKASLPQLNSERNSNVQSWHVRPSGLNCSSSNELRNRNYLRCNYTKPFEPTTGTDGLVKKATTQVLSGNVPTVVSRNSVHVEQLVEHKTVEADEAIPDYALISEVFLADFPEEVVKYDMEFLPPELPSTQSVIAIHLAQIDSPNKFYFNIRNETDEFEMLHSDMQHCYEVLDSHAYRLPQHCIRIGLICAVRLNGIWQRAKILAHLNAKKRIKVYVVDFGITCDVGQHEIKFLLKLYAELPAQALCGRLSNLKPSSQDGNWSIETIRFFKSLTLDRVLFGKVTAVDEDTNQTDLILCDTTGIGTKQINSLLILQGFAVFNEH